MPASAARARRAVSDYAEQLGARDTWPVGVAVSEAVTNAVLRAYPDHEPGEVLVQAEPATGGGMRVVVEDRGVGIRPRPDSPGAGLGLLLIRLASSCTIAAPAEGGTHVCLDFVF